MNSIWFTLLSSGLVAGLFAVAGLTFDQGLRRKQENKTYASNYALAFAFALFGVLSFVLNFLVMEPSKGKLHVPHQETGASLKNKNMPAEKSREQIQKEHEDKKAEEWGEVNKKSYEEIRAESNKMMQESLDNAKKND